ncbi:MarR family transcriptional regulator [uncultured Gulosibacter sp.]|uniref:MarR family winged helix-turn-helix transcriptional regulator n=1 Tax=uncultured Gulosibacter sp. TaxID=1339167 RepID=UPI00288AD6D5|nr:MarR family transcriptional regulator [uncultured Gulosibacter sp.]
MVAVPEPRWLNREERGVWMRLQAVLQLLPAALDSQLRHDAQFTHVEYYALAMLSDAPNQQLQMKELAGHTNSSLPRLSRVITGLESEGYVTRIPNCRDARATDVQLTAKGREALILAAPGHVNKVRETIFDPISSEDVATLVRICDAWLDVLDPNQTMSRDPDHLPGHPPHHDQ